MDIRITFEKKTDEFDPEYSHFEPVLAQRLATNIKDDALYAVAEMWAQCDHYQLLSTDIILNALCDSETDLTR